MTTVRLTEVTIRLNAAEDLAAAGYDADMADQYARAYREAAEAICEDYADVRVVAADYDVGCDAAWAREYGLWQAAHDCLWLDSNEWCVHDHRLAEARRSLRVWMTRNVPGATDALGCPD